MKGLVKNAEGLLDMNAWYQWLLERGVIALETLSYPLKSDAINSDRDSCSERTTDLGSP